MPVLSPADVQEVLDYGLLGLSMSRFSGLWIGLIALADTMDSGVTIDVSLDRHKHVVPDNFALPPGGLHIRAKDQPMDKELRLRNYRIPAALAFARANGIDRVALAADLRAATTASDPAPLLAAIDALPTPQGDAALAPLVAALYATRSELGADRFDALLARVRQTLRARLDRQLEVAS